MYLVGLTGGIASGKSTVAKVWSELGGYCIDADDLAREIVEPGKPALTKIIERFGREILEDDHLDRVKLAQIIFSDEKSKRDLEAITHPEIQRLAKELLSSAPAGKISVYSIPLLAETNSQMPFDKIVTVEAPVSKQIERLMRNRGLTESQAAARIKNQATSAQRAQIADVILNSNQDIDLLRNDAIKLWRQIEAEANS